MVVSLMAKGDPDTMEEAKDRASGSTWSLDSMQDNTIPFSLASFPDIMAVRVVEYSSGGLQN